MLGSITAMAMIFAPSQPSVPLHAPSVFDETDPSAAFTARGLVVAWVERRPGRAEVMYVHSPDLTVFSAPISVSGPAGKSEVIRPHAAANGDRAVIVWSDASRGDHDVYAAISGDGGRTFAPPILVAGGDGGQLDPRAAVLDDGTIAVVFHDSFGSSGRDRGLVRRIRIAAATPLGGGFGAAQSIGVVDPQRAFDLFPAIGAETSTITVAWLREFHDGRTELLAASSLDGAMTFGEARVIDSGMFRALRPRTAGGMIVWDAIDDGENLDVFLAGSGIAHDARALNQYRSDVAVFGPRSAIVWVDHSSFGRRTIAARVSNIEQVVSDGEDDVDHPAVALRDDAAVIVFQDARGGTWDVRATILP